MGILVFALLVAIFLYVLYLVGKGVSKILFIIPLGFVIVSVVSMLPDLLAVAVVLIGVIICFTIIKKLLGFKNNIILILLLIVLLNLFVIAPPLAIFLIVTLLIRSLFKWASGDKSNNINKEENNTSLVLNENKCNEIKIK